MKPRTPSGRASANAASVAGAPARRSRRPMSRFKRTHCSKPSASSALCAQPSGSCSYERKSSRVRRKPVPAKVSRIASGEKWQRCRGTSRCIQCRPLARDCQLATFGSPRMSIPPGRSRDAADRSAAIGSARCSSTWNMTMRSSTGAGRSASRSPTYIGTPAASAATSAASIVRSLPMARQPRSLSARSIQPVPLPSSSALPLAGRRVSQLATRCRYRRWRTSAARRLNRR